MLVRLPRVQSQNGEQKPQLMCDRRHLHRLKCLTDKLEQYKQICAANQQEQADLDAKIAGIKTSLRTQQEGRAGGMGGSDFDASMDFDDDKLRKSGRTKGKLGF